MDAENYHQIYLTTMVGEQTPEGIRRQLEKKLPPKFMGSALNVSDVIAVTKEGISSAYYVDKTRLVTLLDFFRFHSSSALITINTSGFVFDYRPGSWMAVDEIIVDGNQFFLMVSEKYGRDAAYAVVDAQARKAAEDSIEGFDEQTIQQIREFIRSQSTNQDISLDHKPKLELYQKYYENGEYLRSSESYGEQNFDMIDGRVNNRPKETSASPTQSETEKNIESTNTKQTGKKKLISAPGKRKSVLKRLAEKQKEAAAKYGKKSPEQEVEEAERNRK